MRLFHTYGLDGLRLSARRGADADGGCASGQCGGVTALSEQQTSSMCAIIASAILLSKPVGKGQQRRLGESGHVVARHGGQAPPMETQHEGKTQRRSSGKRFV
jgi:hypothetical protein